MPVCGWLDRQAKPVNSASAPTEAAPAPRSTRSAAQNIHGIQISAMMFVRPSHASVQPLKAKATAAKTAAAREVPSVATSRNMP